MTGGLLQLAAYGEQDLILTGNPQMTFFTAVYKRHTNFAIESVQRYFHGEVDFGKRFYLDIDRVGDLVHEMYIEIVLPDLNVCPDDNPDYVVSWVNSVGHAIIKYMDIEIGGQIIDRHYGQWLEIWSELTMPAEKLDAYNYMIGRHDFFHPAMQPGPLHLRIPLQFWFNRNIGLSLPLIALKENSVKINIELRQFDELWVSNTGEPPGCELTSTMSSRSIKEGLMYVDYIFLETDERRKFAHNCHEILIEQLQIHAEEFSGKGDGCGHIHLNFNHPVKELIWVLQDFDHILLRKDWFNFSDLQQPPCNTMVAAKIYIEGKELFKEREGDYFRVIQNYKRHTRVPDNFIYTYSFAHTPEDFQPSGTMNFSKVDNPSILLYVNRDLDHPHLTVFGVNYNVLDIKNGVGGLRYNS